MKLSEILKVAKQYHVAFGGYEYFMCFCLEEAETDGLISRTDLDNCESFCKSVVRSISIRNISLIGALSNAGLPNDTNTLALIWDAVIEKLEEDGE